MNGNNVRTNTNNNIGFRSALRLAHQQHSSVPRDGKDVKLKGIRFRSVKEKDFTAEKAETLRSANSGIL